MQTESWRPCANERLQTAVNRPPLLTLTLKCHTGGFLSQLKLL
uniref:Uncharacterized protein n=1 Tax=Anguilla anguilla TaxID=7936 RepID=A0A0E9RFD9_ANGAN